MYKKLAQYIRSSVDEFSERWSLTLHDYYPDSRVDDVLRKIRATQLLLARSLVEKDFKYLYRHLQIEFQEWILLKNSFRDLMNLEPVYIMLLKEFIDRNDFPEQEKAAVSLLIDELRGSTIKDDLYEIYVGEQEKLFSRQIDELEVLNDVASTDLVGEDNQEFDLDGIIDTQGTPRDLLKASLRQAMNVLGATDGVLALNLDGSHEVVVSFADAPEQHDWDMVKRDTLKDKDSMFDPTVLKAFGDVVDRAVLRNYWNPDLVEDLRSQTCPKCPFRDEVVSSVRGTIECPVIQTLKVHTFYCHQLGQAGELGFFLIARNSPPAFSNEDAQFIQTLSASMLTIVKNYQLYEKQVQLATTDGMTKLYNHRYFQEALSREISRSKRYGDPVSLLYMDIDHFKIFNDTYGHQVGDEVLRRVSRTIQKQLRDTDIACRYGGEELVAILPGTGHFKNGAFLAAEKIRKAIEALRIPIEGNRAVNVTISTGVATYPDNAVDKASLIEVADSALYVAKEGGRNQSIVSDSDPEAVEADGGDQPVDSNESDIPSVPDDQDTEIEPAATETT